MRLLVVGANGLLGSNVVTVAQRRGFDVCGTFHSNAPEFDIDLRQLDIRDEADFKSLVDEFDVGSVVNCAAMTDVDGCEEHPERADNINGRAPGRLAAICDELGLDFVHVSTDYVFDGDSDSSYTEQDEPNPLQAYGESKLLGEQTVVDNHDEPLIVRLSFVYGVHRATGELEGFPNWVCRRLLDNTETPLFTDQHVTPTRAGHAAETLLSLLSNGETGTYHVTCRSCVTPFEFGDEIRKRLGCDERLLTTSSMQDVERLAVRPSRTCLSVSKVEEVLGREQPTLETDVDELAETFEALKLT